MPLKYLYNQRLAMLMHDYFKENTDNRISALFQKSSNNKMQICRMNSECGRNSLKYRGPVIWNCLPESMRSIDSKERFKRDLKRQAFKLKEMTFIKETTFTTNKKDDYIYF